MMVRTPGVLISAAVDKNYAKWLLVLDNKRKQHERQTGRLQATVIEQA